MCMLGSFSNKSFLYMPNSLFHILVSRLFKFQLLRAVLLVPSPVLLPRSLELAIKFSKENRSAVKQPWVMPGAILKQQRKGRERQSLRKLSLVFGNEKKKEF